MSVFLNRSDVIEQTVANAQKNNIISANKGRSLTQDAIRRFKRNRLAYGAFMVFCVLLLLAFASSLIQWLYEIEKYPFSFPYSATDHFDYAHINAPPMLDGWHIFGFESTGRDLLSRTLLGLSKSLKIALLATTIAMVVGILYGAISGYFGGKVDEVMMRIVDILYALPYILFIILLQVMFGANEMLLYMAIGLLEWKTMARIVRGQTLSLKEKEFIEAAKAAGRSPIKIIMRHIVPNLLGPIIVFASLTVPEIILTESFLSFIGFGIQEPATSLGTLIQEGANKINAYDWMFISPAITLLVLLFSLIFIGEGLRDAFDPKER